MNSIKIYLVKMLAKLFGKKFVFAGIPVIIQNSRGEILLGKRSKDAPFYPLFWGLPGGMVDYGENIEQTAKREVEEELGVKIKIVKQGKAYNSLPTQNCSLHAVDIPFYAKIIEGTPKAKDETKEVKWFKPSAIKKMVLAYRHKEILKEEGLLK